MIIWNCAACVVQLEAHSFHNLRIASSNPARVASRFFFWQGRLIHTPVNTAVRTVVRLPGKAAPLRVLCLRVGAFTFFLMTIRQIAPHYALVSTNYFLCRYHCDSIRNSTMLFGSSCTKALDNAKSTFGAIHKLRITLQSLFRHPFTPTDNATVPLDDFSDSYPLPLRFS